MPKALHRCVKKVSKRPGVRNAWAVCNAALKRKRRSGRRK